MTQLDIRHAKGAEDIAEVRRLFEEYAAQLKVDLCFQNFAQELDSLPGAYAPPSGTLFLAWAVDTAAGCIAVRMVDEETCEMKRLFLRDAYRGLGLGERLVKQAIDWACAASYKRMVLDTLPSMGAAQKLYERLGFTEIPAYRFNPVEGARFLALPLHRIP